MNCRTCGGLIVEPNKAYGYAGPVCGCVVPRHQDDGRCHGAGIGQQMGGLNLMSTPTYIVEILNRLERIEALLRNSPDTTVSEEKK